MGFELTEALEDEIVHTYPRPVAEAFEKTLGARSVAAHRALLDAAEHALKYLAIAAWSEYAEHGVRSQKLEGWVDTVPRPSMGHWLRLFQEASKVNATSVLSVNVAEKHSPGEVEWQARFRVAWGFVKKGQSYGIAPDKLGTFVQEQTAGVNLRKLTVLDYLTAVLECRNWFHHPSDYKYEFGPKICAILNPPLRQSLGELLFMPPVHRLMVDYPWARPVDGAQVLYDPETKEFSTEFKLQRDRGGRRKFELRSQTPLNTTSGYLVRAKDKKPYVPFDWRWPDSSRAAAREPEPPAPAGASELARARYQQRYRDYLLDDARLTDKEKQALRDLAELGGLDEATVAEIQQRVDADPEVVTALASAAPEPASESSEASEAEASEPEAPERRPGSKWTRATFLADLRRRDLAPGRRATAERVLSLVEALAADGLVRLDWGRGYTAGTVTAKGGVLSLLSVYSDGVIRANIWNWEALDPQSWQDRVDALGALVGKPGLWAHVARGAQRWPDVADGLARVSDDDLVAWIRETVRVGRTEEEVRWTLRRAGTHLEVLPTLLEQEVRTAAQRAAAEDWGLVEPLRWPDSGGPATRGRGGLADGRIGLDLLTPWRPGVFVGVMVNPRDHRSGVSDPELGSDFLLVLDVARKADGDRLDGDTWLVQPEITALRARLTEDSGAWAFHDHLTAVDSPNRWHPFHLRRPLVTVFESATDAEERYARWLAAARSALDVLLRGGELVDLQDRLLGRAPEAPRPSALAVEGEAGDDPEPTEPEPTTDATAAPTVLSATERPRPGTRPRVWIVGDRRTDVGSWADLVRWTAAYLADEHPAAWEQALDGPEFAGSKLRRVGRSSEGLLKPHRVGGGFVELNLSSAECMSVAERLITIAGLDPATCGVEVDLPPELEPATGAMGWPDAAAALLAALTPRVGELGFTPTWTTDLETLEIENNGNGLQLWVDRRCYLEVWFASKYGKTVWVVVSFASKHKSRDPQFRRARAAIRELDQEERRIARGWRFATPADRLCVQVEKRFEIAELPSDAVVEEVAAVVRGVAAWIPEHYVVDET